VSDYKVTSFIRSFDATFNYNLKQVANENRTDRITFRDLFTASFESWEHIYSKEDGHAYIYTDCYNTVGEKIINVAKAYVDRFGENGAIAYYTLLSPKMAKGCLKWGYDSGDHIYSSSGTCCSFAVHRAYIFVIKIRMDFSIKGKLRPLKRSRIVDTFAEKIQYLKQTRARDLAEKVSIDSHLKHAWSNKLFSTYKTILVQVKRNGLAYSSTALVVETMDRNDDTTIQEFATRNELNLHQMFIDRQCKVPVDPNTRVVDAKGYEFLKEFYYTV
jgi:hypothetical protein